MAAARPRSSAFRRAQEKNHSSAPGRGHSCDSPAPATMRIIARVTRGRPRLGRVDPSLLADRVEGPRLAEATLAARLADLETARAVLLEPVRFER
jgi:hypothetical protein